MIQRFMPVLVAFLVGALLSMLLTGRYKAARYQAAIQAQKVEAAKVLNDATSKVRLTERKHEQIARQVEVEYVLKTHEISRIQDDNRRLARELGGMRDPGRRENSNCPVPGATPAPRGAVNTSAGARLSDQTAEFLHEFGRDADNAASYAQACKQWEQELRKTFPQVPLSVF